MKEKRSSWKSMWAWKGNWEELSRPGGREGWFVQKRGGENPEGREGDKEHQRL